MKKTTAANLEDMAGKGARVSYKKKKGAAKKVEEVKSVETPDYIKVISDGIEVLKNAIVVALNQEQDGQNSIGEVFKKIEIPQPQVNIQAPPAVKSIHVTNIRRGSHGGIESMDMVVERESVH